MKSLFKICLCIFAFTSVNVIAYSQDIPQDLQILLEQFLEEQELEEFDVSDIMIRLESYHNDPLNINTAEYSDLKDLMIISEIEIQAILNHRANYGDLLLIEELQTIEGLNLEAIRRIKPFLGVKDDAKFNYKITKMASEGKNEVFLKWRRILEDQKGYIPREDLSTPFAGDPNRLFVRFRHNYENRLRYGFTLEKDPGEDFFTGSNPQGFDYATGHFYLKDYSGLLKDLVIGDYSFSLGQGLIEHNNFGAGKSAWVTSVKKGGRAFKPYNSVNENDFFRGIGATLRPVENFEISLMASAKKFDATVLNVDEQEPGNVDLEISTIRIDGFHRTESEIRNEKVLNSWQMGGILKYKRQNFHVALNYLHHNFNAEINPNQNLYRKFQQLPSQLHNMSVDYAYRINNFHFFGEVASHDMQNFANLHGLLLTLDPTVSTSIVFRDYQPGYIALSANAFGESSGINNERGIYTGIEIRPVYAWKLSMYADFWTNPWLRFQIDRPSKGKEFFGRLDYIIKRQLTIYAQYSYEQKERNFNPSDFGTRGLSDVNRHRLRLHLSYNVNKAIALRSRIEFNRYEIGGNNSFGMLMYQDFIYKPLASPFSFTARYSIFDTDDFNSRIYAYENDILYEFYIPAFANRGSRMYVNLRYKPTRWLTAEFRIARTQYENIEEISSGNNEIFGDVLTEVKGQLVFKF